MASFSVGGSTWEAKIGLLAKLGVRTKGNH